MGNELQILKANTLFKDCHIFALVAFARRQSIFRFREAWFLATL